MLETALEALRTARKDIDTNINAVSAVHRLTRVASQAGRRGDPSKLSAAIKRSGQALEYLQSGDLGVKMEEIARLVAKGLAIMYAVERAERAALERARAEKARAEKARAGKVPPEGSRTVKKEPALRRVPRHIAERRRAPRAAVEAEIGFQSDTNFYTGLSEDISTGGLFLATFNLRPIGSVLNVNFTLPGGHFISVDGIVRWVREYNELNSDASPGMGIQFENLGASEKDAIDAFIQQRTTLFYEDD